VSVVNRVMCRMSLLSSLSGSVHFVQFWLKPCSVEGWRWEENKDVLLLLVFFLSLSLLRARCLYYPTEGVYVVASEWLGAERGGRGR
jgi:hypothetical protein